MNISDSSPVRRAPANRTPASRHVTLVEAIERTVSFEEFSAAAQTMAGRLEAEGVRALVRLQLYADPESTEAGIVITFSDPDQMIEHINMITTWEEFARFAATIHPIDMRVYGTLNPEAEAWLSTMIVVSKRFPDYVSGFVRGPYEGAPVSRHVTLVQSLERSASFEEFTAAEQAMSRRLEAEGVKTLLRMQVYADLGSVEAGMIATFADSDQIVKHINRFTRWEEFARFASMIRPTDIRVYGTLRPEAEALLDTVVALDKRFPEYVAGFVRGGDEG